MKVNYISDLHLDYNETEVNTDINVDKFVNSLNTNDTYIVAGDFYNNIEKTLLLVRLLEAKHIKGFFTLGNHEFFYLFEKHNIEPLILEEAKGKKPLSAKKYKCIFSYPSKKECDAFLKKVYDTTKNNKYFKYLSTGTKYKIEGTDYSIIGDIGWTSEEDSKGNNYSKDLMKEWKSYNWCWIKEQNKKWVEFLNKELAKNEKLIVVTHYPLYSVDRSQLPEKNRFKNEKKPLAYWFSHNEIAPHDNAILIHGHTHTESAKKGHITNAIGRRSNRKPFKMETIDV